MNNLEKNIDVLIIGAGPSGAAIASWLADRQLMTTVIERQQFPRFTIGESLLPEAINCLEAAGLLEATEAGGYQFKDGAQFSTNSDSQTFNFSDGYTQGRGYAYQVQRADFDHRLINACIDKGVNVHYNTALIDAAPLEEGYEITVECNGEKTKHTVRFLVDASGFGRVLPKLFNLEKSTSFPDRTALFAHLEADLVSDQFDRDKILIAQTQISSPLWYWLIPFTEGRCSMGVICDYIEPCSEGKLRNEYLQHMQNQSLVNSLLHDKELLTPVGSISAYSGSVSSLCGHRYVILGNAGEFIDPIFSSGVTIALKSAMFAAPLVLEAAKGEPEIDWEGRFQTPLLEGIDTFKAYVTAWYEGVLPRLFYSPNRSEDAYRMICSVLAGYVWDRSNPFTRMTINRLRALEERKRLINAVLDIPRQ